MKNLHAALVVVSSIAVAGCYSYWMIGCPHDPRADAVQIGARVSSAPTHRTTTPVAHAPVVPMPIVPTPIPPPTPIAAPTRYSGDALQHALTLLSGEIYEYTDGHEITHRLNGGDDVTIERVRGDRPTLEVGGRYVVWGRFSLRSAPKATLRIRNTDEYVEQESFDQLSVSGGGEFKFRFEPKKKIYSFDVELFSDEGKKSLGGVRLTNRDC